ncbi:MAG TPA: hypothetical protein VFO16_02675, partial [Pseudonocardiaceae bacterium]|nr:hypothetical protein [Pseudonocardiaceae bacterium]
MVDPRARPGSAIRIWAGGLAVAAMLILVAVMIPTRGHLARDLAGSAGWWYVARASGLMAWWLLAVAVVSGLLMAARLISGSARIRIQSLHEFTGVLAVVFTALHLISVFATSSLRITLWQLLIPFSRSVNPVAQGCGVLSCYLLASVGLTSWARGALPWRWWRRLHLLTFPLFALVCAHMALAGTDIANPGLHWVSLVAGAVILFLTVLRLFTRRPAHRPGADAADAPGLGVPALHEPREHTRPSVAPPAAGSGMSML